MISLSDILKMLAAGRIPTEIPSECEYGNQLRELVEYLHDLSRFVGALNAGDLNATLQRGGPLSGSLKGLHANLLHLTWQTQQVAAGDFGQRVSFLGDFSEAFNSMVSSLARSRDELTKKNRELANTCEQLKATQLQLIQQEKMACIGQLAAGVAHEINNPMGFISSNLGSLGKYAERLNSFIADVDEALASPASPPDLREHLAASRKKLKIDFLLQDIPKLLSESVEGAERIRNIVLDLKGFSRIDAAESCEADLNHCLANTLNLIRNELKDGVRLTREFAEIPTITCRPQHLNLVFLNLLLNAAQAVEVQGEIQVRTFSDNDSVFVEITDNGCGIAQEHLPRIFEPFFTTRPVGKGAGLGLSISYDVIKKHGGEIRVDSEVGSGTTFRVRIPLEPPEAVETI